MDCDCSLTILCCVVVIVVCSMVTNGSKRPVCQLDIIIRQEARL